MVRSLRFAGWSLAMLTAVLLATGSASAQIGAIGQERFEAIGGHLPAAIGRLTDHLVRTNPVAERNGQADHALEADDGGKLSADHLRHQESDIDFGRGDPLGNSVAQTRPVVSLDK